jgi:adenosine kinase
MKTSSKTDRPSLLLEEQLKTLLVELKYISLLFLPDTCPTNRKQYILPADSVVFIGCVGKDNYAETLKAAASQVGLRTEYRYDDEQPTGRCGVIITGHNRSMCTDLAAANCYKLDHLKSPPIWALVEQAKVFYVGGYHLTVSPPAVLALAEEAAAKNKIFILSISAPFIAQFFKDPLAETAPYWDYIIGNETEAAAWAESQGLATTSISEIATALAKLPKKNTQRQRIAIVTQGTDPTVVAIAKENGEVEVKEYPVHPINPSQINDTTGAGQVLPMATICSLLTLL